MARTRARAWLMLCPFPLELQKPRTCRGHSNQLPGFARVLLLNKAFQALHRSAHGLNAMQARSAPEPSGALLSSSFRSTPARRFSCNTSTSVSVFIALGGVHRPNPRKSEVFARGSNPAQSDEKRTPVAVRSNRHCNQEAKTPLFSQMRYEPATSPIKLSNLSMLLPKCAATCNCQLAQQAAEN